jgi:hypothetical protein
MSASQPIAISHAYYNVLRALKYYIEGVDESRRRPDAISPRHSFSF